LPAFLGICSNGNALLASGPRGAPAPVLTGGTSQIAAANIASSLPVTSHSQGGGIGNNATLSGTISGPGGLTKIGLGTLTRAA
jgi:hypothetical protein